MLNVKPLTPQQIEENKNVFINLIYSINIDGVDKDGLINYLLNSDFFFAPASTKYHSNYDGGLCQHSLNVYYALKNLYEQYRELTGPIDENSLLVCGLFHDISKINFYEKTIMNKKIYNEQGTKHDNMGKFDWVSVEGWVVKEAEDRFLAGTHEENSVLLLSRFIPLNHDETVAILNHHMNTGNGNTNIDQSQICNKYPLAVLLHMADFIATYIEEGIVK